MISMNLQHVERVHENGRLEDVLSLFPISLENC